MQNLIDYLCELALYTLGGTIGYYLLIRIPITIMVRRTLREEEKEKEIGRLEEKLLFERPDDAYL